MKTTLRLISPSNGFLLGSSTSFVSLDAPTRSGLCTTEYHNGAYSLLTACWNIGLTVCLLKNDGSQLDLPEGILAIVPDVPEVSVQGPVIRVPAKSIVLKEQNGLLILDGTGCVKFNIIQNGNFAFITHNSEVPKLTEWNYLMQASSTLKKIVDSGVGKSEQQQEQLLKNYNSELKRIVSGFGSVCDMIKEPKMCQIKVYRLDISVLGKSVSHYLYQRESDNCDVERTFEQAFRDAFHDISSLAVFIRQLDFNHSSRFGVEVDIDYLGASTYLDFQLQISSIILPERAASALSLNKVFQG